MSLKPKISRGARQRGPGLITGAVNDSPSDIATCTQAGAKFGFAMLWTMALTVLRQFA